MDVLNNKQKVLCVAGVLAAAMFVAVFTACEVPASFNEVGKKTVFVRYRLNGGTYHGKTDAELEFRGVPGEPIMMPASSSGSASTFGFYDPDQLKCPASNDGKYYQTLDEWICSDKSRVWNEETADDFFCAYFPTKNTTYTARWKKMPDVALNLKQSNGQTIKTVTGAPGDAIILQQSVDNRKRHQEVGGGSDWTTNYNGKPLTYELITLGTVSGGGGVPTVFPMEDVDVTGCSISNYKFQMSDSSAEITFTENAANNASSKITAIANKLGEFNWTWSGSPSGWNTGSVIHTKGNKVSSFEAKTSGIGGNWTYFEMTFTYCGNSGDNYRPKISCDFGNGNVLLYLGYDRNDVTKVGLGWAASSYANNLAGITNDTGKSAFEGSKFIDFEGNAKFRTSGQSLYDGSKQQGTLTIGMYHGTNEETLLVLYDDLARKEYAQKFTHTNNTVFTKSDVKVTFDRVTNGDTDVLVDRIAVMEEKK